MAKQLECPLEVYVPEGAADAKLVKIRGFGAEIKVHGAECGAAEEHARS